MRPGQSPGVDRAFRSAAILLALLPLLTAVAVWSFRHWTPTQDMALIDLRVRDVFGPDTPLVGAYSRYGWNHPGPFEFWTVALMGLPFGRPAWATLVGHVVLQIVPIVAALRWAARRSPSAVLVVALLVTLSYSAYGRWMIIEPWNPHVAYAWWVALLVGTALVSAGEHRLVPQLLLCGLVLVQLHVGYLPLVVPVLALALWWGWRDAGPSDVDPVGHRRSWWRRLAAATAVCALLSVPIVVDQLTSSPGNLTAMWHFFTGSHLPTVGLRSAVALMGEGFALPPQWAGRASTVEPLTAAVLPRSMWWILVAVGLLAVGWWCARPLGPWASRSMAAITVSLGLGVLAISRITDAASEYLFFWRTPLAAVTWGAVAVIVAARASLRRDGRRWPRSAQGLRAMWIVALTVLLVRAVPLTVQVAESSPTVSRFAGLEEVTQRLIDATAHRARRESPIRVRTVGGVMLGLQRSLVNGLDRAGADVRTGPGSEFQFGDRRTSLTGVREVWYAVEGGPWVEALAGMPGASVLASNTPLSGSEEVRLRELHRRLGSQLAALGRTGEIGKLDSELVSVVFAGTAGLDPAALDELAGLNRRLVGAPCRCAVVAFDVEDDPDLDP